LQSKSQLYQEGIDAVKAGANSGFIEKRLPSFTAQTVKLEQAANKLGINVINSATFGALSERELALALSTEIDLNLEDEELLALLEEKKSATDKLAKEMKKMAIFLGKKGNTPTKWLQMQEDIREGRDRPALNKKDRLEQLKLKNRR